MPLEITALPKYPPDALCPYKRGLRDLLFNLLSRVVLAWAELENLDALPSEAIPEVQLRPDMRRRSALLHKGANQAIVPLRFQLAKHRCSLSA